MKRIWFLLSALTCAGCASSGGGTTTGPAATEVKRGVEGTRAVVQHGGLVTQTFPSATEAQVWAAVQATYEELRLKITDRGPGQQVASQGQRLVRLADRRASYWVDCGRDLSGPVADAAQVLLNVVSGVGTEGGSVTLGTRVDAEARNRGGLEGVRECTSTGALEKLIAERTAERLGGGGGGVPPS